MPLFCEEDGSSAFNAFFDNFSLSNALLTPITRPVIVRYPHAYYPAYQD